jgi:predicted 3-demethylubiquinone-9 3-methyltransferase (glyoxalase superfamily)
MLVSNLFMFTGEAEEAMTFYVALFPQSRIVSVERYGANEAGAEGSVKHAFTFTPSFSLFVEFDAREQLDAAYCALSAQGQNLMPAGSYDFSRHFAWVQDRFGVSSLLILQ